MASTIPILVGPGIVDYDVNFATFQPLNAEALDLLYASLKRMWRAEEG